MQSFRGLMMLQFTRAMAETREACKNITFSLHYLLVHANAVPTSFWFFISCDKISSVLYIESSVTGFHAGGSLGIIQFQKNA
jgi:hypothetical protein